MESFYSVIYYKTNSLTDEMVSIGLLAGGGEGPFMYISSARIDMLKKVLHSNTFLSARRHLKFLLEKVNKHRNEDAGILLFDPVFSVEQMEVLSKHTKNAFVYSQPTGINEWLDKDFFEVLTQSFFGETIKNPHKKKPIFHLKWKAFYQSSRFKSWDRDLSMSELLPSTFFSFKIDLVNKEQKKLIKGIDFDLGESSLNKKLYELEMMINVLPEFSIEIIHPTPKKNTGKTVFGTLKEKYPDLTFKVFKEFKKKN